MNDLWKDEMQLHRNIGEKQDGTGKPLGKNGCKQTSKESRGAKIIKDAGKWKEHC